MPERHVPVHPDLVQLRHQAKDLLKAIRRGDPAALGELERNHPRRPDHTALFGCVVSQPYRNGRRGTALVTLLLDRGADPNVRASLRKELRGVDDETLHEYRDVTPLGWGAAFHDQDWVNPAVMDLVAARGGRR